MQSSKRTVHSHNKFRFSDYHLAYQVRHYISQRLAEFDVSHNGKFQEKEIRGALVSILHESEQELKYVVDNVFRYDKDNDRAVTYEEFTNFCLEQHFGEMAIQRLHKQNIYKKGEQRIMDSKQFVYTLQYGFQCIQFSVPDEELFKLFAEVDLDHDGFISYEDYFIFLKEYFGRDSFAHQQLPVPGDDKQPVKDEASYKKSLKRISRLIFPQMRVKLIESDKGKKISLNLEDLQSFCKKHCSSLNIHLSIPVPSMPSPVKYQQGLKIIVDAIFGGDDSIANVKSMNNEDFLKRFYQAELECVAVKPARYLMDEIFQYNQQGNQMSKQKYGSFLHDLQSSYETQVQRIT